MRNLTILWLDDVRDPYKYLSKKSKTGAFLRNKEFYDSLMSQYDVDFIWVKNFEEFASFIEKNGLPEFVSFDHDLGAGLKKGLDCAEWLIGYCRQRNLKLPKFFVHSANPNGQREINALLNNALHEGKVIRLSEGQFRRIILETVKQNMEILM